MTFVRICSLALATGLLGSMALPPLHAEPRYGGGFDRGGYTFDRAGADRYRSAYQGYHPMYGMNTRPNWGSRPVDNDYRVNNNFYNRDYNGFNRNWSNSGYWGNRHWNTGWYRGWGNWGWWGANAAAWGVAGLATGAVIGGLVNAAANAQSPVFLVPDTAYGLNYGSVEAVGSYGASFNYLVNDTQLMGAANCQQGLLNGQVPATSDQAQLLNAVCQLAYGSGN